MMRRPIIAAQASAIHTEDHRQVLERDIVNHLVERPLQERRVDRTERPISFGRHAGGEQDRVLFRDAHIEVAVRMMRAEEVQSCTVRHGSGDRDHLVVCVGQLGQALREDLRIGFLPGGLGFAGLGIVWP